MPVPAPIKPKPFGPGLIIPTQSSDHYADATEQMETMIEALKTIKGVKEIINYVIVKK